MRSLPSIDRAEGLGLHRGGVGVAALGDGAAELRRGSGRRSRCRPGTRAVARSAPRAAGSSASSHGGSGTRRWSRHHGSGHNPCVTLWQQEPDSAGTETAHGDMGGRHREARPRRTPSARRSPRHRPTSSRRGGRRAGRRDPRPTESRRRGRWTTPSPRRLSRRGRRARRRGAGGARPELTPSPRRPARRCSDRSSPGPTRCRPTWPRSPAPAAHPRGGGRARQAATASTGDVQAAYRLVAANLRLVVKLAHEYHRNPLALLDLVQEGNIGLMQAVKKFDPERGREAVELRRLVDPRVHPSLHHGQLEDGEAGDDRGPAEALLQAAPGAGAAARAGLRGRPRSCWPSGSTSPSRTWSRWTSASATTRCRIDAPVGEDGEAHPRRPLPAVERGWPRRTNGSATRS